MTRRLHWWFAALAVAALSACAPQLTTPTTGGTLTLDSPEALAVQRAATAAWHRMEAGYLETGSYSTNVLADLALPQGTRWIIESFGDDDYTLRFSSSRVEEVVWIVTPRGVIAQRSP
jgi:hypothetical protein